MKNVIASKNSQTGSGKRGSIVRRPSRRTLVKWALAVVCLGITLALDLLTKRWAEDNLVMGETKEVLPFLSLQRTANSGVAFGLLGGSTALIVVANVIAMLVVCVYVFIERHPLLGGIAGGSVLGGSLGNMIQRITADGHVTDFLKFPRWPNFNLADVFIDAGIAAIFLGLVVQAVIAWRAQRGSSVSS